MPNLETVAADDAEVPEIERLRTKTFNCDGSHRPRRNYSGTQR